MWYQQQPIVKDGSVVFGCDLLENIYLCGINNNMGAMPTQKKPVVICLKISTFVVSTTTPQKLTMVLLLLWFAWKYLPLWYQQQLIIIMNENKVVVICLKISTFVVSTTTCWRKFISKNQLWFAWKYLPLWYQQQPAEFKALSPSGCDLLENIYLCGINNNLQK